VDLLRSYSRPEKLVVAAGAIVGVLCALLVMGLWSRADNRWHRVASPTDEVPATILAVDGSLHLYVGTREGGVYRCGGDPMTHACTQVTASALPVNRVPLQWQSCGSVMPNIPEAPGQVVDSIFVGRCLEANTFSKLVILDDGSIWQWRRVLSWANWFALGVCVALGLGFGAVGGILVVELKRRLT
jgi:hypothetical protein